MNRHAICLATVALVAYALTVHPSVPGGDSGELICAAHGLGISHPPGYALHAILGHVFTWLPVGSIGFRVNLMSAICDAAAAGLLAMAVSAWTKDRWAGVLAGGLFAFAPGTWRYAVVTEVFALNNVLVAALLLCVVRYSAAPHFRWAAVAAFVLGIGVAHHHTLLLWSIPIILATLWRGRSQLLTARGFLGVLLIFLSGASLILYLPWSASRNPPIYWGEPTTVAGIFDHLLRRHVGTFTLASTSFGPPQPLLEQLRYFTVYSMQQTLYLGLPIAIVGQIVSCRKQQDLFLGVTFFVSFYFYLLIFLSLSNLPMNTPLYLGVVERFWQLPTMLIAVWIGHAYAWLFGNWKRFGAIVTCGLLALQVYSSAGSENQRNNNYVEEYGRAILKPLPERAVLLVRGDLIDNSVFYMQQCVGYRTDVQVVELCRLSWSWGVPWMQKLFPDLKFPGKSLNPGEPGHFDLISLVKANPGRHVFVCGDTLPEDGRLSDEFELMPEGYSVRVVPTKEATDVDAWMRSSEATLPQHKVAHPATYPDSTWESTVTVAYWGARWERGRYLLARAVRAGDDQRWLRRAAEIFEGILRDAPVHVPIVYKLLGACYLRFKPLESETERRMQEVLRLYLKVAPEDDPDRKLLADKLGPGGK